MQSSNWKNQIKSNLALNRIVFFSGECPSLVYVGSADSQPQLY